MSAGWKYLKLNPGPGVTQQHSLAFKTYTRTNRYSSRTRSSSSNNTMAQQKGHRLDLNILDKYLALPQPKQTIQAEYVWIGGSGQDLRCKTRVRFICFSRSDHQLIHYTDTKLHTQITRRLT